jgi:FAD synthase
VNIFSFEKEIYGETLAIDFQQFIRGDKKFNDLEELKYQLGQDKIESQKILETITFANV